MKRMIAILLILAVGCLPLFAQDRITKGKDLLLKGHTKEALALFRKAAEANAKDDAALSWLSKTLLAVQNPDAAYTVAKDLMTLNAKNPDGYMLSAQALSEMKRPQEAYSVLSKGLKETKNNVSLLVQLGLVHLANDSTNQAVVAFSQAKEIGRASCRERV